MLLLSMKNQWTIAHNDEATAVFELLHECDCLDTGQKLSNNVA